MWGLYLYFILKGIIAIFQYIVLPILIFISIIVIVIVTYQHRKYGNSIYSCFKPKDITDTRNQLLFITLDRIKWYKIILKLPFMSSNYIMIDGNGISIFKIFTEQGVFRGNNDSIYLIYTKDGRDHHIKNPLLSLKNDENKIKTIIPDVNITTYLLISQTTYLVFNANTNITNSGQLLYQLTEDNKYNNIQINEMANKLKSVK